MRLVRYGRTYAVGLTCLCLIVGFLPGAPASRVDATQPSTALYVVGDSWAADIHRSFDLIDAELSQRGVREAFIVHDYGVGGTTAEAWAQHEVCRRNEQCEVDLLSELTLALANDTTPSIWILIILGGNDVSARYRLGPGVGVAVFDEIEADLLQIGQELSDAAPTAHIFLTSYDILNFQRSITCRDLALIEFGTHEPGGVNRLFEAGIATQQAAAALLSHTNALDVAGTLQGRPGTADWHRYSPAALVRSDCHHLTPAGYALYVDAIFDQLLGQDDFALFLPRTLK